MNSKLSKLPHYKLVRLFSLNVCENQKQNHYDSLGVTPKATQGDIKNAYYKLSKQYHPDVNKDNASAADKFRKITEAYEVLGNLKNRKLYDRGILVGSNIEDHTDSTEKTQENYKHASFYHHRNKPSSSKVRTGKTTMYDMDEWTRAHYSQTFNNAYERKHSGNIYVKDKVQLNTETAQLIQLIAFLGIVFAMVMVYETNAHIKFDQPSVNIKTDEKPD